MIANAAMSVDGKLATAGGHRRSLGSAVDLAWLRALRARVDAVLVGGRTFRTWGMPLVDDADAASPWADDELPPRVARAAPLWNAVLTRRGVVGAPRVRGRWPDSRVRLRIIGPPGLDREAHEAELGAEVERLAEPSVQAALDALAARGCGSVVVEGGGDLLAPVVAADRLDELFVTLTPWLVGGATSPTLLDGPGFGPEQMRVLRLKDVRRADDELFLRYEVSRARMGYGLAAVKN